MYREIKLSDVSKELLEQIKKGAFLTVKNGDKVNTMTIGWGSLGVIWNRPVFMVMVRNSRYTHELIDGSRDFTVSFPLKGQLKNELAVCGSKSGRDVDKINKCGLSILEGMAVDSPLIDGCDIYIECRILYKSGMNEKDISEEVKISSYNDGDFHTMYYGEIVKLYEKIN